MTRTLPAATIRRQLTVTERVPTGLHLSAANGRYLAAKARHGAHTLDIPLAGPQVGR